MTRRYPVRRVAAQDQGGALAPATPSTQAAAARKRGGGLARRALLTLSLAGHPSMPEGGAIKSLCCAAAGIFLPKPKARAGVAYPTTSVRQGAEDAATLRSHSAPHAQLVEGYKPLLNDSPSRGNASALRRLHMLQFDSQSTGSNDLSSTPHDILPIVVELDCNPALYVVESFGDLSEHHESRINRSSWKWTLQQSLQCFARHSQPRSAYRAGGSNLSQREHQPTDSRARLVDGTLSQSSRIGLINLNPQPNGSLLSGSNEVSGNYRQYRANRLSPARGLLAPPRPGPYPPAKRNHQGRQEHPLQKAARAQVNREFFGQHGHPLAISRRRSMKALGQPVQGVAA